MPDHDSNQPLKPQPDVGATPSTTSSATCSAETRRRFLQRGGSGLAALVAAGAAAPAWAAAPAAAAANGVKLSPIADTRTDEPGTTPDPQISPDARVGYAIVGLGRLSLNQILPGMAQCKYSRVTALVSGDRDKALKIARQYGIPENSVYDYTSFERLADNKQVDVVYIVLPNGMHAEFTQRAARIGKHVLCEKPMANSVAECQSMIDACRQANRKLMIAYRSQYEPMDRMVVKMVKEGRLGTLREFIAGNSQNTGDPGQWRLKKALSGGGPLPDVGIYCLNAARFLTGEEPYEAFATITRPKDDPRFKEVESGVHFLLRFPSGLTATCMADYASHESRFFRLQGAEGWAEMSPAFGYNSLSLRHGMLQDGKNAITEVTIDPTNQFAREIDHMSACVVNDTPVHTPGEEGLQDQRVVQAIYASAHSGRVVQIVQPNGPTRGPDPDEENF